jgi:hypothetical protein
MRSIYSWSIFYTGVFCFFVLVIVLLFSFGTDEQVAKKALDRNGYTDIQMTGYDFFGCSKGDFFHTGFSGKDSKGNEVRGTVCSGLFRGSYIRIDD